MKKPLAVAALLVLAVACSKNTPAPSPSAAVASIAPQASASPGPSGSAAPSGSTAPSVPHCATSDLSGSLSGGQGTAGSVYETLALTNHSSAACTLSGYPGVSLVDASGTQLGQPATRDASHTASLVTLSGNGGAAYAAVRFPNPGNFSAGQCSTDESANLRVYPPGQTQSLLVASKHKYCPGFSVTALSAQKP